MRVYKPGKLENLLDNPKEAEQITTVAKQDGASIWQTIKGKLDEIQRAAIDTSDRR